MGELVGFFTPVCIEKSEVGPTTFKQRAIHFVENYFYLGGRKAYLIQAKSFEGKYLVETCPPTEKGVRWVIERALKIASYILFGIPMLIAKLVIRATHDFRLVQPQELIAQVDRIPETNDPDQRAADKERKKQLLATAYFLCIRQLERCSSRETPPKDLALKIGEILSKFGILHYADASLAHRFEVSQQILWGSLNAQLYAAGVIDKCFDFAGGDTRNLLQLSNTVLEKKPFASMEATFINLDTEVCYNKINDSRLEPDQLIEYSKTLRYINGTQRYVIRNIERRDPKTEECNLFQKLLPLAEKIDLIYAGSNTNAFWELWELRYNDFDYFYEKVTKEKDKLDANWDWLRLTANNVRNVARIANKSAKSVDDHNQALKLCKTYFIRLIDPMTYATLEAVLEGRISDEATINALAKRLVQLDISNCALNMAWFAIVPSNLAYAKMIENPQNVETAIGPLLLSKALADIYESRKMKHHNFEQIRRNYDLLMVLTKAQQMEGVLQQEEAKVQGASAAAKLTEKEIFDLRPCVAHIKREAYFIKKPLERILEATKDYPVEVDGAKKLLEDAEEQLEQLNKTLQAVKSSPDASQVAARAEMTKVQDLMQRGRQFAAALFAKSKTIPQKI